MVIISQTFYKKKHYKQMFYDNTICSRKHAGVFSPMVTCFFSAFTK